MGTYSNPYPGEEFEIGPTITDDLVQREFHEDTPSKYEEFRGMVRQYLAWKKLFGNGEFVENTNDDDQDLLVEYQEKQIWSLIRYDDCRVMLGYETGPHVDGWYISSRVADKDYADVLFEMQIECPECEGTSEIDGEECLECEAEGTLWFRVDY